MGIFPEDHFFSEKSRSSALGKKTIELRSWQTKDRGDFLVCASKGIAQGGAGLCLALRLRKTTPEDLILPAMPKGSRFDGIQSDYAWLLCNVRPVLPSPVKGTLNFFSVEDDLVHPLPSEYADHFSCLRAISCTPGCIRKKD